MQRILLLFSCFFLFSCSMNKRINKIAKQTWKNSPAFENSHTGVYIFDPQKELKVYDYQADKYFVPASNTKLMTCYAAMKYLGDSIPTLQYEVLNNNTVLIRGLGDPTFLHLDYQSQPVVKFLEQFQNIQLEKPQFHDYMGAGWAWDDYAYDYSAPRSQMPLYGDVVDLRQTKNGITAFPGYFQQDLKIADSVLPADKIRATRPWSENLFLVNKGRNESVQVPFIPADTVLRNLLKEALGRNVEIADRKLTASNIVYSRPLDSMLSVMMHRSDNFFAEQSLLMVSNKELGYMSDRAIINKLLESDYAGMPQKPAWVDGSGLSHYNLFSPRDIVFILQKLKNDFGLERIEKILPTGGTGTLSSLYLDEKGKIFAKTGTLNGVVSLSGFLITHKNKLLLFSMLVNNHKGASGDIRKGFEAFLTKIMKTF